MREDICEVCGSTLQQKTEWVWSCKKCGFQSSNLKPAEGTGIQGLESLRRENFENILDRLENIKPLNGLKILEVGSAWGWFLEAASKRGAVVVGIEPEKANADLARSKGLNVENGFFPHDLKDCGPYDVIVFNDVFEHIPSPSVVVHQVESLLAPEGIAIFNYPSSDGVFFRIANLLNAIGFNGPLERLWQKGLASPHVSYFNPNTMRLIVSNNSQLKYLDTFRLKSVSRNGLYQRVSASHSGVNGRLIVSVIWCLTLILPLLPSDIEVSFFQHRDS